MIWEKVSGQRNQIFTDVAGVGRYLIRRSKDDKAYRAFLNGKRTVYTGKTIDEVKVMVERVQASIEQFEREQAVTLTGLVEEQSVVCRRCGQPRETCECGELMAAAGVLQAGTGNRRGPPPDMEAYAEELYGQAQHYAADKRHIVLTDIYLALESCARKCAELERRVSELEEKRDDDGQT